LFEFLSSGFLFSKRSFIRVFNPSSITNELMKSENEQVQNKELAFLF